MNLILFYIIYNLIYFGKNIKKFKRLSSYDIFLSYYILVSIKKTGLVV